jgi:hypothetical protein
MARSSATISSRPTPCPAAPRTHPERHRDTARRRCRPHPGHQPAPKQFDALAPRSCRPTAHADPVLLRGIECKLSHWPPTMPRTTLHQHPCLCEGFPDWYKAATPRDHAGHLRTLIETVEPHADRCTQQRGLPAPHLPPARHLPAEHFANRPLASCPATRGDSLVFYCDHATPVLCRCAPGHGARLPPVMLNVAVPGQGKPGALIALAAWHNPPRQTPATAHHDPASLAFRIPRPARDRLQIRRRGDAEGPTLFLLHGDGLSPLLSSSSTHCSATGTSSPDWRGFGPSQWLHRPTIRRHISDRRPTSIITRRRVSSAGRDSMGGILSACTRHCPERVERLFDAGRFRHRADHTGHGHERYRQWLDQSGQRPSCMCTTTEPTSHVA